MRNMRLNLGSVEVSRGAKDGSKRISKTKQDPNFDLSSLWDRTAIVFSATSPSSISTVDRVDFSSSFHFCSSRSQSKVKSLMVSREEEVSKLKKQECLICCKFTIRRGLIGLI